jgi:hypothetical protein
MTVDPGLQLAGRRHRRRIEEAHNTGIGADFGEDVIKDQRIAVRGIQPVRVSQQ